MSARAWAVWITVIAVLLIGIALLAFGTPHTSHPAPEPTVTDIQLDTI